MCWKMQPARYLAEDFIFPIGVSLVAGEGNGCVGNKWELQPNSYYRNLHLTSALPAFLFCILIIYWNTGCCCLQFPASEEFWGLSVLSQWFILYFCKIQPSQESLREGLCKSPEQFIKKRTCVTKDWSSFRKKSGLREPRVLPGSTQNVTSLLQ